MTTLAEIRGRLAAATPGPSVALIREKHPQFGWVEGICWDFTVEGQGFDFRDVTVADADFIAHAPDDIDHLLRVAEAAEAALSALNYGVLQAEATFDPLIRDAHAGSAADRRRHAKLGIAGTPSVLTLQLTEARDALRAALEASEKPTPDE
jgi:hypothetical protein